MKNLLVCLLLYSNIINAQEYPKDYFAKPLDIDLSINGSFGELRYNHFHSGVDFSGNRKVGAPIFATADGVVSRIQINEKGYGKAIYIKHPNGYTTVYGHLDSYNGAIQEYVLKYQYREEKYMIEAFPLKDELIVKKGDIIGFVGNTGSSGGPHLHYEIRDTQSEETINPFLFGVGDWIVDKEKPILNELLVYPISEFSYVNGSNVPILLSLTKQNDGNYVAETVKTNGTIGFGVNSYDVMNNKYSKNGIYKLETFLNGSKTFDMVFDRLNFDDTRKINHFIDYERLFLIKERIQKLFVKNNFQLNFIKQVKNDGKIEVKSGESFNYKIVISDFHNNQTVINIPISYSDAIIEPPKTLGEGLKKIDSKRDYIFSENNTTVEWDAFTFYEDCFLNMKFFENEVQLFKDVIPLDKSITIQFDLSNSIINKEKAFIGLQTGNSISHFFTWKKNNILSIKTKNLGTYKVFEDTVVPTISPVNFTENNFLTELDVLKFNVNDDLSGIKEIKGFINGKWALFEYEYKNKEITHYLKDKIAQKGLNKVTINVTDNVGNNAIFETNFQLN